VTKITNDGLTRSGTGCFIAVLIWMATVGVKGLNTVGVWKSFRSTTADRADSAEVNTRLCESIMSMPRDDIIWQCPRQKMQRKSKKEIRKCGRL